MSLTYTAARDEILTLFKTAWDAQGTVPPVLYWDRATQPPTSGDWARITLRHTSGGNAAISNRFFVREGLVTVQLFTNFGEGLSSADLMSKVVSDAFQGQQTAGGVWFRNVRVNEIGQDGEWFQTNVLIDFEYNEVI